MATRKSPKPQPTTTTTVATKPTIIALKSQKSTGTPPESLQQVVEPITPVEPPALLEPITPVEPSGAESKPTKLPPLSKRSKVPLPNISQEPDATPTQAEPLVEGDASSLPNNALFQALGIIVGEVRFDESEQGSIEIEQKLYPLFYAPNHKMAYQGLKKQIERTAERKQRLLVYPRVTHFPFREQHHRIGFQLVAFEGAGQSLNQNIGLSDFEFKLCGLWQFIPVCSVPCLSVFKNLTTERIAHIKDSPVEKRVRFMKASHIPVLWRDAPTRPFRFNPKLDKEQQGQASFVGIIAKFLPGRDVFGFSQLCLEPTLTPPQFLKAGKKDKAEVLQNRRQRG